MVERVERRTPDLWNDVLWGVEAIAAHIKRNKRQTYWLIEQGALPVTKLGHRTIIARKSELDRVLPRAPDDAGQHASIGARA